MATTNQYTIKANLGLKMEEYLYITAGMIFCFMLGAFLYNKLGGKFLDK